MRWTLPQCDVESAKQKIDQTLNSKLPSFAKVSWNASELCVTLDKGGKSEFKINVKSQGSDVLIEEAKRNVSFLHKPFVGKVEEIIERMMGDLGAKKA